jgi:predicted metal-dependent phosphoesterase TrpH
MPEVVHFHMPIPGIMPHFQKIDLHLHTLDDPRDPHVWHTAEELIDQAAKSGFTALAITLHARQFESDSLRAYAGERGILLIPGVEQDVEGCHVLLINFPRRTADAIRTFEELRAAKAAWGERAMVIAAHPFYPNQACLKEKLFKHHDLFDAVELSGFYHRFWDPNQKAQAAANRLGLPMIGNSDTHALEQFGTMWTEVEAGADTEDILTALKQGRGRIFRRSLRWSEMAVITYKVVVRGYMPWIDYKTRRKHAVVIRT